ncbi:MAG: alginate lyase family protein [Methyloglobulus sp.]|nr:alginate lyase family protein [Methyloglobulus sp.]
MSAVPTIDNACRIDVLKAPFNTWTPAELLAYFQSRKGIAYFAVANEQEVIREKIDGILSNNFNLNEETYRLPDSLDWLTNPSTDVEWSIMLHKFYYAVGLGLAFMETGDCRYAEKWIELTSGWIATVPVDFLSSDVTGRRIQNWVFGHYYFVTECPTEAATPEFYVQFLTSIHQQTSYLCQHLTPARNHRTLELYTIFLVAVVFPELKGADSWLQFSIDELAKNAQTDLLDDGVHCELSTDYHHIVLRNFLAVKRLAVLNDIRLPTQIDSCIKKALEFSVYVHKPDGFIPSLSDGDTGCFLSLLQEGYELYGCEEMLYVATKGKQGTPPCHRSKAFPSGGYYILRSGWGESLEFYEDERYLVFDCGDLGAGNHGHLDLLSFEIAAYGQSLIVDPGRYTYDESGYTNWRVLFRGTSYHNTVLVDGHNQTRYEFHKQKFKIKGSQPDYELKAFISRPGFDYLHGIARSHEYPVVHERKILFVNGEYWVVCDVLRADDVHNYDLLFHLAASAQDKVSINSDGHCFTVDTPNLVMVQPKFESATVSVDDGYVSPTYGVKHETPVLKFNQKGAECCFYTVLYPYKNKRPTLTVSSIPIFKNKEICSPFAATCLVIISETEEHVFRDMIFVANERGEFKVDHYTINSPVFFQREDEQGQLLAQFDCATLDAFDSAHYRQGN